MLSNAPGSMVRQIGSLFEGSSVAGLSDRQLLDRFIARRDAVGEAAFAGLVFRHGRLVLGVCNELLGDRHDAEDAVQAVFLILAQKAQSIRDPDLLGNWLYGVALRTCRQASLCIARRRKHEEAARMPNSGSIAATVSAGQSLLAREQAALLHEEIERLPREFRLPVVLCYFESFTSHKAARRLGWPDGTLRSRMARAREKLRRALSRRGVVLLAGAFSSLVSLRSAEASVSSHLCDTTAHAAIQFAAGQYAAPLATAVARQLLRSTLFHKAKFLALSFLLLGTLAASAGYLTRALARNDEPTPSPPGMRPAHPSRQQAVFPNPDAGRITIHGRALAPDGKPAPGARVAVLAGPQSAPQTHDLVEPERDQVLGSARADADGRFRVDVPRVAANRSGLVLVVGAPGWALAAKSLSPGLTLPDQTITLEPERVIRGRFVDLQGQPIAGVSVRVSRYHTLWYAAAGDAPLWPAAATSDGQGRFTLRGLGQGSTIALEASSEGHAPQTLTIDPRDQAKTSDLTFTLSPAQLMEVRVTRADDGKPVPGAWVNVQPRATRPRPPSLQPTHARTSDRGTARIIPYFGESFWVTASPPAGEPYLGQRVDVNWRKGAVGQSVELKLKRGVLVRGTITEEASGKAVVGAFVTYLQTRRNNKLYDRGVAGAPGEAVTARDGTFQIVVPAGPGHLLVRAATPDYLHLSTNNIELGISGLPNWLFYPDALARVDLEPDETQHEVTMRLKRGVTVAGRVIGPDGRPLPTAIALGRTYVPYRRNEGPFTFESFRGSAPQIKVRDGQFEIPGCDPEKPYTFYFLDRQHQLGATVELSGRSAGNGPLAIQLQKCGAATVRYKDHQGKPIAGYRGDPLMLIITPGADRPQIDQIMADMQFQVNLDTERLRSLRTGADGRMTFVSLIPDATYRLRGHDFTAEAGKTIDLPDITLPRP
jgi:RNA polymerase sigma factor (sigma-70 family)